MRPRRNKAAMMVGARPFHRQQNRAAPLAANPDTLDETQDGQDDRTPDADLGVSRHERDQKGRDAHQQQSRDQCRFAPDAVAVVAENRGAYRAGNKADCVNAEGLQSTDQRIGRREVQLRKDQPGDGAVQKEIIPLDRRADRAGDHRPAQLHPMLEVGERARRNIRCRHLSSSSLFAVVILAGRGQKAPAAGIWFYTAVASKMMPPTIDAPPAITPIASSSKWLTR